MSSEEGMGHADLAWYQHLVSLSTSDLEGLLEAHARASAQPGEETFQMIRQILEERREVEA